jgi:hypothetical protein
MYISLHTCPSEDEDLREQVEIIISVEFSSITFFFCRITTKLAAAEPVGVAVRLLTSIGRCWLRISVTLISRDFLQPLQANSVTVLQLCHGRLLLYPF